MDPTEAEDIKKRWQEYTEELYKKDLHDPDNHDGGMQSQVGLRKHHYEQASGGDGIPAELFQILKYNAVKVLHSICQQIWKTQQQPQYWKKVSIHSNPKERQCKRMLKLLHNGIHLTC